MSVRRRDIRRRRAQRPAAANLPPPVGGWNTRDDPANMPPTDAQVLTNWVPAAGEVHLREGFDTWATVSAASTESVGTLFELDNGVCQALIMCAGGGIYDASDSGAASTISSGYNADEWIGANFNGRVGLCNSRDNPVELLCNEDGSITAQNLAISNVDKPYEFAGVHVFKTMTFFWKRQSQDFWYSAVNTLGGSLTKFPLGDVAQKGGYLMAITTWTRDGGNGPDDFAVFIMSSGEVIVYQGSDPGLSTRWALVNRYYIGRPVSNRGIAQISGGIVVITDQDYVFLPEAFQSQGVGELTKLSGAAKDRVRRHGKLEGWQAVYAPKEALLFFNVPRGGGQFDQHVVNLHTRAATKFEGLNARSWAVYKGDLYFGSNGVNKNAAVVYKYGNEKHTDVYSSAGAVDVEASITAECRQAYVELGYRGEKIVTHYRNLMSAAGDLTIRSALSYDFGNYGEEQLLQLTSNGADWGSDWGVDWADGDTMKNEWVMGYGSGQYVSLKTKVSAKGKGVRWHRSDIRYERGGRI